jgi:hypothetical protein
MNGDIVICVDKLHHNDAFIYNLEDKTVESIKSELFIQWFDDTKDYVESLVSVH